MKELTETLSKNRILVCNNGYVKRRAILCVRYRDNDN